MALSLTTILSLRLAHALIDSSAVNLASAMAAMVKADLASPDPRISDLHRLWESQIDNVTKESLITLHEAVVRVAGWPSHAHPTGFDLL